MMMTMIVLLLRVHTKVMQNAVAHHQPTDATNRSPSISYWHNSDSQMERILECPEFLEKQKWYAAEAV